MLELTAADLRRFCSKRGLKIGKAFSDDRLSTWIAEGRLRSNRVRFLRDTNKVRWILAYAARECCESQAEGPDHEGYATRARRASLFADIMTRNGC